MKKIIVLFVISLPLILKATTIQYPFSSIPEFMRKDADAVVREEHMIFELQAPGKAIIHVKKAITLINEDANSYRYIRVDYDKFSKVLSFNGEIYNEKGELINKIGKANIVDMSALSDAIFVTNDRFKGMSFPLYKFPYTIVFEYTVRINSFINFPSWKFQSDPDVSVQKSTVRYVVPKDIPFRYYTSNFSGKKDSIADKNTIAYQWQEINLPAHRTNAFMAPFDMYSSSILAATNHFKYAGYEGDMSSWQSYGKWYFELNEGRDVLPESEITKIRALVKDIPNEREKVKKIYEYLQSKTRYLAIQLGIGGLQPLEARLVAEKGYGDCKALTNYMQSLLNSVNIKSYYALIKSGRHKDINPYFVSNQFDHVILCVPLTSDTIWLECTDQTIPFNYLGEFTSNRYALLISPDGGKLVRTPDFKKEENEVIRSGEIKIESLGNSSGKFESTYHGIFFDRRHELSSESDKEIKDYLNQSLDLATFKIDSVFFSEDKNEKPGSKMYYEVNIRDFAVVSKQRLFFVPSLEKIDFIVNDTFNVRIVSSTINIDSIVYDFPDEYTVEYLPENVDLTASWGTYHYSLQTESNRIIFVRKIELNKGDYSKDYFNDFYKFINRIATADHKRILLKQKDTMTTKIANSMSQLNR